MRTLVDSPVTHGGRSSPRRLGSRRAGARAKLLAALFSSGSISLACTAPSSSSMASAARLTHSQRIVTSGGSSFSVSYPDGWSVAQPASNSWVVLNVPTDQQDGAAPTARVVIGYLERANHADAMIQLAGYAHESSTRPTFLVIGGWPALQRAQLVPRPQPGNGPVYPDPMTVQVTTAVAADGLLVRLEADLPSDADQQLEDLVLEIGRSLTFQSTGDPALVQQDLIQLERS